MSVARRNHLRLTRLGFKLATQPAWRRGPGQRGHDDSKLRRNTLDALSWQVCYPYCAFGPQQTSGVFHASGNMSTASFFERIGTTLHLQSPLLGFRRSGKNHGPCWEQVVHVTDLQVVTRLGGNTLGANRFIAQSLRA